MLRRPSRCPARLLARARRPAETAGDHRRPHVDGLTHRFFPSPRWQPDPIRFPAGVERRSKEPPSTAPARACRPVQDRRGMRLAPASKPGPRSLISMTRCPAVELDALACLPRDGIRWRAPPAVPIQRDLDGSGGRRIAGVDELHLCARLALVIADRSPRHLHGTEGDSISGNWSPPDIERRSAIAPRVLRASPGAPPDRDRGAARWSGGSRPVLEVARRISANPRSWAGPSCKSAATLRRNCSFSAVVRAAARRTAASSRAFVRASRELPYALVELPRCATIVLLPRRTRPNKRKYMTNMATATTRQLRAARPVSHPSSSSADRTRRHPRPSLTSRREPARTSR